MPEDVKDFCIIQKEKLSDFKIIGEGGFGYVYKAKHKDWGTVAVKSLKAEHVADRHKKSLQSEAEKLSKLNHQNIVQLYGVVLEAGSYSVVLEYVEYGSLDDFINTYKVPWNVKIQMIYSIVLGMNYLHTQEPSMIHRDLKTQNLLVTAGFECKLTDFGLSQWKSYSRQHTSHSKTQTQAGTVTHIPPEVWDDCNHKPDIKCDVYAMAILLWEIVTEKVPFEGLLDAQISLSVSRGQRPDTQLIPDDTPAKVVMLIELCWKHDPQERPTFADMKRTLDEDILRKQFQESCRLAQVQLLKQINDEKNVSDSAAYSTSLPEQMNRMNVSSESSVQRNSPTQEPQLPYPVQRHTTSLPPQTVHSSRSPQRKATPQNVSRGKHNVNIRGIPLKTGTSSTPKMTGDLQVDAAPSEPHPQQETGKPKFAKQTSNEFDAKAYLKKGSHKLPHGPQMNYYGPMPPPGTGPLPANFMQDFHVPKQPSVVHKSGSGSTTMIYNTSGLDGVMIGDHNVMVVNNAGASAGHHHYHQHTKPSSSMSSKVIKSKITKSQNAIDDENMRIIAKHLGQPWMMLGRHLGLTNGELEAVENDYRSHGHEETVYQMLLRWKQRVGKKNCKLVTVANKLVEIGKPDVALLLVDK